MKITPLEIRQKEFNKNFRGYDKDEVTAFLQSMSAEWERLLSDYQDTKKKLEEAEKEVQKLKEVENSLFKTLKTAEDTGANLVEQSKKAAELHLKETKMQVDSMLNEANNKARNIIEEAEDVASSTFENLVDDLKEIEEQSKNLEAIKESFISEIKNSAREIIERMDKIESKTSVNSDLLSKIKSSKKEFKSKKAVKEIVNQTNPIVEEKAKPKEEVQIEEPTKDIPEEKPEESKKPKAENEGSFFDQID